MKGEVRAGVVLMFCGFFGVVAAMYIMEDPFFQGIEDSTKYNLYEYNSNTYYETCEVGYNMEDKVNSTHLYDFGLNGKHGNVSVGDEGQDGVYGDCIGSPMEIRENTLNIVSESYTFESWLYPTGDDVLYWCADNGTYPSLLKIANESMHCVWGGGGAQFSSNGTVTLNKWNFVAFTYNYSSFIQKWYINDTATTVKEYGFKSLGYHSAGLNWNVALLIGRYSWGYTTQQWQGKIDEVRVYDGECRTLSEIQTDMLTSMAQKLSVNTETSNDVIQLWYENDSTLHEQQVSGSDNQIEFNVFTFSNQTSTYNGIIKVTSAEMQYEDIIRVYNWGDIYDYSVPRRIETWMIGALVIVLSIIIGLILVVSR